MWAKDLPKQLVIRQLQADIVYLNDTVKMLYDQQTNSRHFGLTTEGVFSAVKRLDEENKKLKAIVAELVDYVYKDKR